MKGKALRRALETKDSIRIAGDVPLIVDTTEWITPDIAQEMLQKNKANRPINWNKVEEYSKIMAEGKWKLHAQGIILDPEGNILTGQKRLWALIYSGVQGIYMRVSRGNPKSTANLLDRGTPQSARDLASRITERKHSPVEASIARAICVLKGNIKPSTDEISIVISENSKCSEELLIETKRIKKTKGIIMILASLCFLNKLELAGYVEKLARSLEATLRPETPERCWAKGAAFTLAMEQAKKEVQRFGKH
jgi:hypothetical protein